MLAGNRKCFRCGFILFILINMQQFMSADIKDRIAINNPVFDNSGDKWVYDWGWGANTVQYVTAGSKVNVARIMFSGANWIYLWPASESNDRLAFLPNARYAITFLVQWESGDNRIEIGYRLANNSDKKIYPQERVQDCILWRGSIPQDGKWYKVTAVIKTPKFNTAKNYLVPAFGMSSQLTNKPSTINLDDILITVARNDAKDSIEQYQPPKIPDTPQIIKLKEEFSAASQQIHALEEAIASARLKNRDVAKAAAALAIMKYFPIRPDQFEGFLQPSEMTPENLAQISSKLGYIKTRSQKWMKYLKALEDKPASPARAVPDMMKLSVRGGYFQADGVPILLMGPEGDRLRILDDLDFAKDLGANAIGVEVTPLDVATTGFDERLKNFLDEAQKRNITVRVMLSGHFFPAEVSALPESQRVLTYPMYQGFFMVASSQKVCIESDAVRKVLADFVQKIISVTKNHPAVSSYIIWNEPYYMCYCHKSVGEFRQYLSDKYKTIDVLNDAWKTGYKDFPECTPPKILQKNWDYSISPNNRVALYDWMRYNDDRVYRFFSWMKDNIRNAGDNRPTHVKKASWQFAAYGSRGGIDSERLNSVLEETPGFDTGYTYEANGDFALESIMSIDYAYSTSRGKPISHDELHMIIPLKADGTRAPRDVNIMRSCILEDFVHGVAQQYFFVWRKGTYYHSLLDSQATPPNVLEAYSDALIDVQHEQDRIMKLQAVEKNVAILHCQTSFLYTPVEQLGGAMFKTLQLASLNDYYHAVYPLSYPVRFVTERQIENGDAGKLAIIMVPTTQYVQRATSEALLKFVNAGGTLIVGPCSFIGDDRMQANDFLKRAGINITSRSLPQFKVDSSKVSEIGELLAHTTAIETINAVTTSVTTVSYDIFAGTKFTFKAFGIREDISGGTAVANYSDGKPAIVLKKIGKGKLYYLGTNLDMAGMSEFMERIYRSMPEKVARPVIAKTADGKIPSGVEVRTAKDGSDLLVYIFNSTARPVNLKLSGVSTRGIDVFKGTTCCENIQVGPITPILLKYTIER